MDFSGTWKVYSEENLEEFLKVVGAPEMIVKMRKELKPVLVIEQNGKDFTYTMKTPIGTKVHSFSLGKESEMTAVDGRKIKKMKAQMSRSGIKVTAPFSALPAQGIWPTHERDIMAKWQLVKATPPNYHLGCTVREENGKLIAENEKFTSVREIQGDDMVETITAGSVTFISRSKRA